MTKKMLLLAAPLFVTLALTGCAQPQSTTTDDVPATQAAAPAPKPTAAHPDQPRCYDDAGISADQEQRGGEVTWPAPLADDQISIEPSCWVDTLGSDRNIFLASWFGLDAAQTDSLNQPIEAALEAAGYHVDSDSDGISRYTRDGAEQPALIFEISRVGGTYQLQVNPVEE